MEQKEALDKDMLEKIAAILKVPAQAIKNFDEEKTLNIISNTFNDHAVLNGILYNPTFNPIDKVVELYERMLKEKDAMIEEMKGNIKNTKN